MEYPLGGERIHNSPSTKELFMATLAWHRMDVLDELKPSMLVVYDMLSVMESIQVWQQRGASRSPADRVLCVLINVYVMNVYVFRTHMLT